jgi:AdoMet-dependent heme synthase
MIGLSLDPRRRSRSPDSCTGFCCTRFGGWLWSRCTIFPPAAALNFDETPFLAIWEVTQSCDLACKHCRAAAQPIAHPDELTNAEGKALIDQIAAMRADFCVYRRRSIETKGRIRADPLRAGKGVQVALTPSATPLLTREAIFKLKEAGLVRLGISLDGSTPEIHDAFRGLPGAWARTIQAIEWANEAGIPIQVHTTISRHNAHDLDNLCALFEKLAIVMWNVFFLVPVGRGQLADLLSGEEFEEVFGKIYELSHRVKLPDQDHGGDALPALPVAAQPGRAAMGHGHPHTQVAETQRVTRQARRPAMRKRALRAGRRGG